MAEVFKVFKDVKCESPENAKARRRTLLNWTQHRLFTVGCGMSRITGNYNPWPRLIRRLCTGVHGSSLHAARLSYTDRPFSASRQGQVSFIFPRFFSVSCPCPCFG